MTVKQLRKLLEGVDDNVPVLIPVNREFDGRFYRPCSEESGIAAMGMGVPLEEEDYKEAELLGKLQEEDAFLLVPCGFDEEKDHTHEMN